MATRTVGIDLAIRGAHVASILDEAGRQVGSPIRFRHSAVELAGLIHRIRHGLRPADQVLVLMEPTGMAWFPISQWMTRAGFIVIRVKGQRVKALRRYLSEHAKTDVVDAQVLGSLPSFGQKGLTPLFLPNAKQHALRRLSKQRRRYQEDTTSIRQRLRSLIRWACPAMETALPELNTMVSLAVLERYFNPRRLRRLSRTRLIAFLRANVGGKHPSQGPFVEELAAKLYAAAVMTMELYPCDDVDFDLLQLEVRQEVARFRFLQQQIERLDREIDRLYRSLHPDDHLRTIPGLGILLGPSLLSVLHTWKRFGNQRRIRGFTGLFPRRRESGGQDNPSQRISKGGNGILKRDLLIAADVARKIDPELAKIYYTMMVEKGKHHRQALCAIGARLVNRIHTVLREGRPYVLRDLDGRPITLAEGKSIVASRFTVPVGIRRARRKGRKIAA